MLDIEPSNSKSKYFIVANSIAGKGNVSNVNKTEEFEKSGLTMKTIRVKKTRAIKESMSFENIDYQEDCSTILLECKGQPPFPCPSQGKNSR